MGSSQPSVCPYQNETLRTQNKFLANFIKTKAQPPIFFLPAKHNAITQELAEEMKRQAVVQSLEIERRIAEKKVTVEDGVKLKKEPVPISGTEMEVDGQ